MDACASLPQESSDPLREPQTAAADWAVSITPVGMVTDGRLYPQQNDHWGGVTSVVHVDHRFSNDCLLGLDEFSHVEIVFLFHLVSEPVAYRLRQPGGRPGLPEVGVFADCNPRRPNRIGTATCEILKITGHQLTVWGLDAVVGTPILDIKPVMRESLPRAVRQPAWVDILMRDHFAL